MCIILVIMLRVFKFSHSLFFCLPLCDDMHATNQGLMRPTCLMTKQLYKKKTKEGKKKKKREVFTVERARNKNKETLCTSHRCWRYPKR